MANIPLQRIKRNGKIDLWDLGPQIAPKPPDAPDPPDNTKMKGAELAAAELEYEDQCDRYKDALRAYTAAKKDYRAWHDENGGPVKVELWGVDARHALDTEPERYFLDLPKGKRPGAAQIAANEREAAEIEELKRARALDPQFGGSLSP